MLDDILNRARSAVTRLMGLDGLGEEITDLGVPSLMPGKAGAGQPSREIPESLLRTILTVDMPGESYTGRIELSPEEIELKKRLERHVTVLASDIGIRNTDYPEGLDAAGRYIEGEFQAMSLETARGEFTTSDGHKVYNLEALLPGDNPERSLVIGAHYDTVDCPGANDNASGVACLIETARDLVTGKFRPRHTIRFTAFTNEEPPYFFTEDMGSRVYARGLRENNVDLIGMICLEELGFFSDESGSQMIPPILRRFFPHDRGDFIGFFSDNRSRDLLRDLIGRFRKHAEVPSEGLGATSLVQGIDFSDHASFWREGFHAVMVTDTAFMRYKHYHTPQDTPDKLEWTRFTKVAGGLTEAVKDLVG